VSAIAVVGAGGWGKNLVRNLFNLHSLRAICDTRPERCQALEKEYPTIKITPRIEDILSDSSIEGVAVATPPQYHHAMARLALEAGKHVFVEKPMALEVADAQNLVDIALKNDRRLMVGHLLLYHPAYRELKKIVERGDLGKVLYMTTHRLNLGTIRLEEDVLWSMGPHSFSSIIYLLDEEPEAISCTGCDYVNEGIVDVAWCHLQFSNGRRAYVHLSWLDPHKSRVFTMVGNQKMAVLDEMDNRESIKIYDKGVADGSPEGEGEGYVKVRSGSVIVPPLVYEEPLKLELKHFIDSVRNGTEPRTDGKQGVQVVRMLVAAQESMRNQGRWVKINAELHS